MPVAPAQLVLAAFELTILFGGAGLLISILANERKRQRWLRTYAMPYWAISPSDFVVFAVIVFLAGLVTQGVAAQVFGKTIAASANKTGLEIFAYGAALHGGFLVTVLLFPSVRRRFQINLGPEPPPLRYAPAIPWSTVLRYAAGTLMVALPIIALLSLGWTALLRACGLPDEPQDLIGVFAQTKSAPVIAGMLLVACVLAPLSEELIFRAGLYRVIRQKLGRMPALLISALLFGALHQNWAGFLPLAVLGMLLALAYEATGSIRVPIIAHALFNLNTILIVLSGLPGAS